MPDDIKENEEEPTTDGQEETVSEEAIEIPNPWRTIIRGGISFTILLIVSLALMFQYITSRPYDLLPISVQTATSIENFLSNHHIVPSQITITDPLLITSPKAHYYQRDYIVHLPSHTNRALIEATFERKMRNNNLIVADSQRDESRQEMAISYGEYVFANVRFLQSRTRRVIEPRRAIDTARYTPAPVKPKRTPSLSIPDSVDKSADKPIETSQIEPAQTLSLESIKKDYDGWSPQQITKTTPGEPSPPNETDDIILAAVPEEVLNAFPIEPVINGSARLAIIVDDGGYGGALTDTILSLDTRLTLAILPNTPHGSAIAEKAHGLGFEIMLHMPMENTDPELLHPGQINIEMDPEEITLLTLDALTQIPQAIGVNNHTGSKYTTDPIAMAHFMDAIKGRDLFFVDSRTTTHTTAYEVSKSYGFPSAQRDLFLDHDNDESEIRKRFAEVIEVAKTKGQAIAICHFRPTTARLLKEILPTLEEQGVTLVKVSELVQ